MRAGLRHDFERERGQFRKPSGGAEDLLALVRKRVEAVVNNVSCMAIEGRVCPL